MQETVYSFMTEQPWLNCRTKHQPSFVLMVVSYSVSIRYSYVLTLLSWLNQDGELRPFHHLTFSNNNCQKVITLTSRFKISDLEVLEMANVCSGGETLERSRLSLVTDSRRLARLSVPVVLSGTGAEHCKKLLLISHEETELIWNLFRLSKYRHLAFEKNAPKLWNDLPLSAKFTSRRHFRTFVKSHVLALHADFIIII